MNRREFIHSALSTAILPPEIRAEATAQTTQWYDRPMRWAQLAFVEDDPGNYDQSSGWITSARFMPTPPASARAAAWLSIPPDSFPLPQQMAGRTDAFGDMVKGCRRARA